MLCFSSSCRNRVSQTARLKPQKVILQFCRGRPRSSFQQMDFSWVLSPWLADKAFCALSASPLYLGRERGSGLSSPSSVGAAPQPRDSIYPYLPPWGPHPPAVTFGLGRHLQNVGDHDSVHNTGLNEWKYHVIDVPTPSKSKARETQWKPHLGKLWLNESLLENEDEKTWKAK